MEASVYHLVIHGQQAGPFSVEQLQQMLADGDIMPDQLAWRPGLQEWLPVRHFLPPALPQRPLFSTPLVPQPVTMPPQPVVKKTSRVWLWVTLAVLVVVGALVALAMFGVQAIRHEGTDEMSFRPLFEDRAEHQPVWQKSSFEAAGAADKPEGGAFDLIRYHTPAGELAAYLTPDPKDGKKHPAIVWAHGGFGGIGSFFWEDASKRDDQSARAFREKGIVMMCPSWRGENDNPGRFELFYGEVEDFLAALEHVKKLPYVDAQRVYIGGHSTGGTMTLLAACATDQFRAAFSFGGMLNGVTTLEGDGYGNTPYSRTSNRDHRLRSPLRYAAFISKPVFYFEGGEFYDLGAAALMKLRAKKHFQSYQLPGDHFDILHPITHLIAEKIVADTGTVSSIRFTKQELEQRYAAAFADGLAAQLARWKARGGSLTTALKKSDRDDLMPRSDADVQAVTQAVAVLNGKQPVTAEIMADVALLLGLRDEIEDDEILDAFDEKALPQVIGWAQAQLKRHASFAEKEAEAFLSLLGDLAATPELAAADLVVAAVQQGVAPENHFWSLMFEALDEEHPHVEHVMKEIAKNPPAGAIGLSVLQAANDLCLDEWEGPHPFDSAAGAARLKTWLTSSKADDQSYAFSAALGAAFLKKEYRAELINLALQHSSEGVRLEGAWSDVKAAGTQGLVYLQKACLELHQSKRARSYLEELDHEKDVPPAALEPAFAAQAEMSRWLQHPNELGEQPLSIEVFDHRTLFWPPTKDKREMWLIKFTYQFDGKAETKTSYGCVGSMTWSSFTESATAPKPEELYLNQCTLELRHDKKNEKAATDAAARLEALQALKLKNPGVFDSLR